MTETVILASKSPRRIELLKLIFTEFEVIPAKREELLPENIAPDAAVRLLAEQKAAEVRENHGGALIIAADTVVSVSGEILGKPRGEKDAADMLKKLSGRVHSVFTGVCAIRPDGEKTVFSEQTLVEFYPLSDKEISDYIATGEPMDKAGAYGIQERGALFVKRIEGDFFNVMGLPAARLYRELNSRA